MTRAEMMERMGSSEFYDWMALEQVDPFGQRRADIQAGIVAQTFANVHLGRNQKPFETGDFMLRWEFEQAAPAPVQSVEDQMAMMLMIQAGQNAQVAQQGS